MKIHTVKQNESIKDIAKKYGISEQTLRDANGIESGECAVGEEMLIVTPTRTHITRYDDTVERICLRYRLRKNDLLSLNPWIRGDRLEGGREVVLKYDERTHGMAVNCGVVYNGCTEESLRRALPYATYIAFAARIAKGGVVTKLFDENELLEIAKSENKIPLLKIHCAEKKLWAEKEKAALLGEAIVSAANKLGYKGVILNSIAHKCSAADYSAFLADLKKRMMGEDLILITECDEDCPTEFNDLSDGSILCYNKLWKDEIPSFDRGEATVYSNFACRCESAKTFIEVPAFARINDGFCEIEDAKKLARTTNEGIETDDEKLISKFTSRRETIFYHSLENIKATLELSSKYGYMGICFDVMRTPPVTLSTYNSMFKTVSYSPAVSREGCGSGGR